MTVGAMTENEYGWYQGFPRDVQGKRNCYIERALDILRHIVIQKNDDMSISADLFHARMKRKYFIYDEVSSEFILIDPTKKREWDAIDSVSKLMTKLCTYENQMQIEFTLNKAWDPMDDGYWERLRAVEGHSHITKNYRDVGRTFQRIPVKPEHVKHIVAFCTFAQFHRVIERGRGFMPGDSEDEGRKTYNITFSIVGSLLNRTLRCANQENDSHMAAKGCHGPVDSFHGADLSRKYGF